MYACVWVVYHAAFSSSAYLPAARRLCCQAVQALTQTHDALAAPPHHRLGVS